MAAITFTVTTIRPSVKWFILNVGRWRQVPPRPLPLLGGGPGSPFSIVLHGLVGLVPSLRDASESLASAIAKH